MRKLSIKNKIFFLVITVLIISVNIVAWYGFTKAKESYIQSALNKNEAKIESLKSKLDGILETIPADIVYNSNFYALKKLIIWRDLEEQNQIKKWRDVYNYKCKFCSSKHSKTN
jgi:uncharacterized membrane protein (Fun14 family)